MYSSEARHSAQFEAPASRDEIAYCDMCPRKLDLNAHPAEARKLADMTLCPTHYLAEIESMEVRSA